MGGRAVHRSAILAIAVFILATGLPTERTNGPGTTAIAEEAAPGWAFGDATAEIIRLRDSLLHQDGPADKLPASLAGAVGTAGYAGDDTCQFANDGECDDPGIGTGACAAGTDYSDCWRIVTGVEDDSCRWANDGECDEVHLGTGACTQATDRTDCGAVAYLRNQTDSCRLAWNGVCNEPGLGDGACDPRTDRGDCIGRDRPLTIEDHFFGRDDRVTMDTTQFPWSVIGMLVGETTGSCTATLVADDVILTAAHCIEGERGVDARAEFQAAFTPDGFYARANVIAYLQSPDRVRELTSGQEPAGTDWALLRIDQPLGAKLGHVGVRPLLATYGEGALTLDLFQAGYSWDTGANLSGNIGCRFTVLEDGNRVLHTCDTTHGDSGSPFMVRDGDQYFVLATDSTFRAVPNEPLVNVATRTDAWADLLPDFIAGRIGSETLVTVLRK
ncbi:MAG: serine protease [Bauldia sp.]